MHALAPTRRRLVWLAALPAAACSVAEPRNDGRPRSSELAAPAATRAPIALQPGSQQSGQKPSSTPARTSTAEVETGADPSRLLLRAEWASQYLAAPGPSSLFVNNLKLDVPLDDGRAAALEVPIVAATLPTPTDDEVGLGDVFVRGRQVSNSATGSTILGVELGLDTATDDALGSGKWQANPSLAYVHRFTPQVLLAGAAKQRLSVAGDDSRADLHRTETRWIGILLDPLGRWLILDWQPTFDWNRSGRLSQVLEAEVGTMCSRSFGVSVRAGTALGGHEDRDYSAQLGFRMFF